MKTNSTPDTQTDNARLSHLNSQLATCKPYRAFVACAEATGHGWNSDADLAAFEAIVGRTLKWDTPLENWGPLWIVAAQQVLDGRLQWLNQFPKVAGEEAGYFEEDVFPEGGII